MKHLFYTLRWDFVLIVKYGIAAVALIFALIYCVSLLLIDTRGLENLVAVLIFSDPVMYGFLFTAVMILFEKEANTHRVLAVTPMPVSRYIISKQIAFTVIALLYGSAVIISAQPEVFHPFAFLAGVILSSSLFVCVGIIGASFVKNFNQFILLMPIVLTPVCLPFLDYFALYESPVFYLIPTQACLLLFKASTGDVALCQYVYALVYLLICNVLFYKTAVYYYKKRILKISRHE